MELESVKYYRSRDGEKRFVIGRNPFTGHFVSVQQGDSAFVEYHHRNGVVVGAGDGFSASSSSDLIAEWKDPVEHTFQLALYDTGTKVLVTSDGLDRPDWKLLAKKEVPITEGEGLGTINIPY